jgi:predicted HTH domain antitoxin
MTITVQVPDALLANLATSSEELNREIRLAAAIHLYSRGLVTQGTGAEVAGLSRRDFIEALGRAEVPSGHFGRIDRGGGTWLPSASSTHRRSCS